MTPVCICPVGDEPGIPPAYVHELRKACEAHICAVGPCRRTGVPATASLAAGDRTLAVCEQHRRSLTAMGWKEAK